MKKLKKIILVLMLALSLIAVSGCENDEAPADIYASIYPIEYITKNIVDGELSVKAIYPRGKDIHDYDLNIQDIIKLSESKLVLYIGIGLEPLIEQFKSTTLKNVPTISLSDGLDLVEINSEDVHEEHYHEEDDHHDGVFYDPHIWLDLNKMQTMTSKVLASIIETFDLTDEQITKFSENANNLINEFKKLDEEFFELIDSDDILNKTIIVDHDAYIYWEVRYGLERIRIRNDNESTDAIAKDMIEKIELAKSKKINYICLTKNEVASTIANQYKTQLELGDDGFVYLHHLATITSAEEKAGMDYLSIMRGNLEILEKVLPRK